MSPSISAVINTLDEATRLPYALRSLRSWVDEIVVVDMASADGTAEVARRLGARVFPHPRTGYVEPARAFACERASGDWIFLLDADEVVPAELSRALREIAGCDGADAVRLSRVNFLLGEPVLHAGWNPSRDRHLRFWKHGAVELPREIHRQPVPRPGARVLELDGGGNRAIVHLSHPDVATFLGKLNAYTSVEAAQAFERGERSTRARALLASAREWAVRYLWHRGYRDGWRGFYLSLFMAGYRLATHAKLTERAEIGPREAALQRYAGEAERILAGYAADEVRVRPAAEMPSPLNGSGHGAGGDGD